MGAKQTSKHRKYKVVGFVDASGNDYNELNKEITIVLCEQENGHTFPFSIKEFPKHLKRIKMKIEFGAVQIADFDKADKKMYSWDFYYEQKEYQEEIKRNNPLEVVLPANKTYRLVIDYPVEKNYIELIKTDKKGMTRIELADQICKHYRKMYEEEERSFGRKANNIPGMNNREATSGKYGIWGHDIGDLVLCSCEIKDGVITLGVDS